MRALTWLFKSNEVDGIIKKLGNCKGNISFSLQVNQAYIILFIFLMEKKLTILPIGYKFLASIKKPFSTNSSQLTMLHLTPTLKNIMLDATKVLESNSFNK
jgi:hypothetical protein